MSRPGRLNQVPDHMKATSFGDTKTSEVELDPNSLLARRDQAFGPFSYLFYQDPVEIVRGEGIWLYDNKGKKYLDVYNNVASVGHCHPRFVEAVTTQIATLNTHTRYLHKAVVDYSERLTATLPDGLDTTCFVCTGTEANDLATQIARAATGNYGMIVTDASYHGNSTLVRQLSTGTYPAELRPDFVEAVYEPNLYRGAYRRGTANDNELGTKYASCFDTAIQNLNKKGHGVAAFLCDTIFDMGGAQVAPPDYIERAVAKVRAAGGLYIADEVQAGFGRTGDNMWGFENYGVVPDIVTMGKPMGNGIPLAGLVTTKELAQQFGKQQFYFNTFGGNPVSAIAGLTVLDIIQEEGLQHNAKEVGTYLLSGLKELQKEHLLIGDIKGRGLFLGVELVKDRTTKEPAREEAEIIREWMRHNGVLMGTASPLGNVLKIRPPLVFSKENADLFLDKLAEILCRVSEVKEKV